MRLFEQGSNVRLLKLDDGTEILFSYGIPVAGFIPTQGYIRTDEHHSPTTSRHINGYVGQTCKTVAQEVIDDLLCRRPE